MATDGLDERHLHAFFGYCTVLASIVAIGSTVALFITHYNQASRSLSLRRGAQRRRLLVVFLVLALLCFFAVTALKYVDPSVRAEIRGQLDDMNSAAYDAGAKMHRRAKERGWTTDEKRGLNGDQVEIPHRFEMIWSVLEVLADNDIVYLADTMWLSSSRHGCQRG